MVASLTLIDHRLTCDDELIFDGLDSQIRPEVLLVPWAMLLAVEAELPHTRLSAGLGAMPELQRFFICHRYEPYWMKPRVGTEVSEIVPETQMLLGKLLSGRYLLLVPLFGDLFRFSLQGNAQQHLSLLGETGDSYHPGRGGTALLVAVGDEPFQLVADAAELLEQRLHYGTRRVNKPLPDFVETFGWCTWDAFYTEVSHDKIEEGLESFRAGGVEPRFLILDDGWQPVSRRDTGESRLTGFGANQRFPGGLADTVRLAKQRYAVETFLVWHAMQGYWGGVDAAAFSAFSVADQTRQFGEGILAHAPAFNQLWWGNLVGLVLPRDIHRFFDQYHRSLSDEGVDGVKVDSQALLEGVSQGLGGRVAVTHTYRHALETSVETHFHGRLINCMSNAQETWYGSRTSNLIRSSIDFFPNEPGSHGRHLYTNAMVGLWFGQFMHPDWDMFQSGHGWGAYHAAGRAISGGPVYCSDKPDGHDFSVLRALVCSDGTVLRCDQPGLPTLDILFRDPTREAVLLKIWNRNGSCGVVGVFNAQASAESRRRLSGVVRPSDVVGLEGERFACYAFVRKSLAVRGRDQALSVALETGQYEIYTIVPIVRGFAPIGLADMMNTAGAVLSHAWPTPQCCEVRVRDGGRFVAFSQVEPERIEVSGALVPFRFDAATGWLDLELSGSGPRTLAVKWRAERGALS